jgi:hypothetical protein
VLLLSSRSRFWRLPTRAVLVSAAILLAGCGDEETESQEVNVCDVNNTPYDSYAAGMVAQGAQFSVKLLDSIPSPPARGENQWSAQLLDGAGNPASDVAITRVKPFMPDHGHGSSSPPDVGAMASDGTVQIEAIDFMMPGVWNITFEVDVAGTADNAVFSLCIDG